MGRKSKGPWWYRTQWVVDVKGKRFYLGPEKDDAERRWHEIMSRPEPVPVKTDSLAGILDAFLDWTKQNREPATYEWYLQRLSEFDKLFPTIGVQELKPKHVQEWVGKKNSPTHRRGCIIALSRALNWGVKFGEIEKNPIKGMEKPAALRREVVLSDEQYKKLLEVASDQEFRDLVEFCWESGCRPQEAFRMEARHLDLGHNRIVFAKEEAKGRKQARVIHLTEVAAAIVKRLAEKHPSGPLMRNEDGNPWHRNNVSCRFRRMRKKLGFSGKLYFVRHTFVTNGLKSGVNPISIAVLASHTDPSMIARVYQHVQQDTEHMQSALGKIRPKNDENAAS